MYKQIISWYVIWSACIYFWTEDIQQFTAKCFGEPFWGKMFFSSLLLNQLFSELTNENPLFWIKRCTYHEFRATLHYSIVHIYIHVENTIMPTDPPHQINYNICCPVIPNVLEWHSYTIKNQLAAAQRFICVKLSW